jgi:membrane protein YdbS with pleckstrin-like domain
MKFGIIDLMMASLQVAFIVMKLCGAISWSWWLVMLPILFVVVLNVLVFLLIVNIKLYKSLLRFKQEREKLERERSQSTTTIQ